jgi:hypothetical protein
MSELGAGKKYSLDGAIAKSQGRGAGGGGAATTHEGMMGSERQRG